MQVRANHRPPLAAPPIVSDVPDESASAFADTVAAPVRGGLDPRPGAATPAPDRVTPSSAPADPDAPKIDGSVEVHPRGADLRADPEALLGQVLGERYELLRLLGRGGMGAVYLARHVGLDAEYAVKVLLEPRDPEGQRRFASEARLASRVRHPNTVFISDFGVARGGLLYLVMEHIPGRSLAAEVRRRGRLDRVEALHIAIEVARGLQAIHDCGIVHRDMKPDSVPADGVTAGSIRGDSRLLALPTGGQALPRGRNGDGSVTSCRQTPGIWHRGLHDASICRTIAAKPQPRSPRWCNCLVAAC